jgi:hypothetical protein
VQEPFGSFEIVPEREEGALKPNLSSCVRFFDPADAGGKPARELPLKRESTEIFVHALGSAGAHRWAR